MKKWRVWAVSLALATLFVALALPALPAEADGAVRALFINVGKADAALIELGELRFLVDTGAKGSYDQLEKALSAYGVQRLDGVILTHTDKDHVGGLKKLLKSDVEVAVLYAGRLHSETSLDDHPVTQASLDADVPLCWLSAGDTIAAGECAFQVLGPLTQDVENENNNSLVIDLQTPQGNLLLTGDMEAEEEAELLSGSLIPPAAVLKVAHHGEDDTTSRAFVQAVRPQVAVISTSTAEEPDTPDRKVLTALWEAKALVATTQDATAGILVTLQDGRAMAERIDWK